MGTTRQLVERDLFRSSFVYPRHLILYVLTDGSSYWLRHWLPLGTPVINRMADICQSGVWVYIDTPRQHAGYARFVRRYSPVKFSLSELKIR